MSRHDMFSPGRNEDPPSPRWRTYTRADLVRAIVGQQWAVAMSLMNLPWASRDGWRLPAGEWTIEALARLPCAVDVVEEMERT